VAAPYAIQLFSDGGDDSNNEIGVEKMEAAAGATATGRGGVSGSGGTEGLKVVNKVAKLLCEDGKKLFKACEVCEEGALECDAAAAEAAVRAIAFAKSLAASSSSQIAKTGAATTTGAAAAATAKATTGAETTSSFVFVRIKVVISRRPFAVWFRCFCFRDFTRFITFNGMFTCLYVIVSSLVFDSNSYVCVCRHACVASVCGVYIFLSILYSLPPL